MVKSAFRAFIEDSGHEVRNQVGLGEFTQPSDKVKLFPVVQDMVDNFIAYLQQQGPRAIIKTRNAMAMSSNFLQGLAPDGSKEPEDDMEVFLGQFRFASATSEASGFGPVHCAAMAGNGKVLRQLVAARADVNQRITKGRWVKEMNFAVVGGETPLMTASYSARGPEMVQVLLELRADLTLRTAVDSDALQYAAGVGNLGVTKYLLDLGMNPDAQSAILGTTVGIAAVSGMADTLRLVLERGASANSRCFLGWTPLIGASLFGHMHCCRVLVEHKADIAARVVPPQVKGEVVLGLLRLTRLLVPSTSPLAIFGSLRQQTALSIAKSQGNVDIVDLLEAEAGRLSPGRV